VVNLNTSNLGDVGTMRVKSCLASGRLLSRHVLARINLDAGVTLAAGFDGCDFSDSAFLERGIASNAGSSRIASAAALLEVLHRIDVDFNSTSVVVENDLAKPDDPAILSRPLGSVIITGDVVYHFMRLSDLELPEALKEFLGSSSSGYPLNAFFMKSTNREQIVSAFAQRRLGIIVEHVEAIVNSIFDNDGFSIWISSDTCSSLLS
jgi:hypothetical protein